MLQLKRGLSIIALLGILFHAWSGLVIYAGFSINRNYISTNLCVKRDVPNNTCKGSCHLKKQLESAPSSSSPSGTVNPGPETTVALFFQTSHEQAHTFHSIHDGAGDNPVARNHLIKDQTSAKAIFHPPPFA